MAPGQPALGKCKREEEEEDCPEYEHDIDPELQDYQAQLYTQYLDDKYGADNRKQQRLGIALAHGTPLDKEQLVLYTRLVEQGIVRDY